MILLTLSCYFFFFFNDTATPEIYPLPLHDPLPICGRPEKKKGRLLPLLRLPERVLLELLTDLGVLPPQVVAHAEGGDGVADRHAPPRQRPEQRLGERSEEHTSELQSLAYLVCRLLL